jgi:hypothetical protein
LVVEDSAVVAVVEPDAAAMTTTLPAAVVVIDALCAAVPVWDALAGVPARAAFVRTSTRSSIPGAVVPPCVAVTVYEVTARLLR